MNPPPPPFFTAADLSQLASHGLTVDEAAAQIEALRSPPPAIELVRPATIGDGITRSDPQVHGGLIEIAEVAAARGRVMKFVPASGAATRMFADLIAARSTPKPSDVPALHTFFDRLDEFPFAEDVRHASGVQGHPPDGDAERRLLDTLLDKLGYGRLPKGLIPFHRNDRARTAFEEHLFEGVRYVCAADGRCRMHFSIAAEFRSAFDRARAEVSREVEQRFPGRHLDVSFSEQASSTDTLAIDDHGHPFRLDDGTLLLRPGGHGALLSNLNALAADLVVVKNIDNILPEDGAAEAIRWQQVLIGRLVQVQDEIFEILARCEAAPTDEDAIARGLEFARKTFARSPRSAPPTVDAARRFAVDALDRPLRVCGVVRNEGEPGGAPFWVRDQRGNESVQIVEASQIDRGDAVQQHIFRSATHFNPVDLVCGVRSWQGAQFDLMRFVDASAVFVSEKTHQGRRLKALERPGLWNGAMAGWNTICVEVPAATFAPVKTVFDLLRPEHRRGHST